MKRTKGVSSAVSPHFLFFIVMLSIPVLNVRCGHVEVGKEERPSTGTDSTGLYNAAMDQYDRGRYGRAADMLESLIATDPYFEQAYFLAGLCYFHLERYDRSIRHFRQGLSRDPEYLPGYLGLGISLYFAGSREEAATVLEEGLNRLSDQEEREAWRKTLRMQLPDLQLR
jgi:tetratricopeptide (TPR) repeat protein